MLVLSLLLITTDPWLWIKTGIIAVGTMIFVIGATRRRCGFRAVCRSRAGLRNWDGTAWLELQRVTNESESLPFAQVKVLLL